MHVGPLGRWVLSDDLASQVKKVSEKTGLGRVWQGKEPGHTEDQGPSPQVGILEIVGKDRPILVSGKDSQHCPFSERRV